MCGKKKPKGTSPRQEREDFGVETYLPKNCETEHEKNLIVEFKIFYFICFLDLSQILTIKFISFLKKEIDSHTLNLIEGN